MKFDIYGRFTLQVIQEQGRWRAFRVGEGKRRPESHLIFPPDLQSSEIIAYLDDIYHEMAQPGQEIREL